MSGESTKYYGYVVFQLRNHAFYARMFQTSNRNDIKYFNGRQINRNIDVLVLTQSQYDNPQIKANEERNFLNSLRVGFDTNPAVRHISKK